MLVLVCVWILREVFCTEAECAGTKRLHLKLICVNTHVHGKPPLLQTPIHMCISNHICVHKHSQIRDRKLSICLSHPPSDDPSKEHQTCLCQHRPLGPGDPHAA